ncbi:MoaD/ThiS family protein [Nocardia sp. NPDC004573]
MVEIHYFAAIAQAVGKESEILEFPAQATLADLRHQLRKCYGDKLDKMLSVCAYVVGDEMTRDLSTTLTSRVDVLPPFAGG